VRKWGLEDTGSFIGFTPARDAFSLGRIMVMPSRAESFPYIVLEALAANKPLIATRVGGIPEIFGKQAKHLIEPENTAELTLAIQKALKAPTALKKQSSELRKIVQDRFTISKMASELFNFYYACGAQAGAHDKQSHQTA
jgi:glycosyltransferase involved in cell wall biosynthesis